jgi:hypothetical protein
MFPLYRKSKDSKNFYQIINEREFFQLKIIGSKIRKYHYIVDKFPEILMIKEMIDSTNEFYEVCERLDFQNREQNSI